MPKISLLVIPAPAGVDPFVRTGFPQPMFTGDGTGDVDLACGSCDFLIARGLNSAGQIFGKPAIECPSCGTYNTTRT